MTTSLYLGSGMLIAYLAGRTWTRKECVIRSSLPVWLFNDKDDKISEHILQEAILTSLGLAWPDTMDTQKHFINEILTKLETTVVNNARNSVANLNILRITKYFQSAFLM